MNTALNNEGLFMEKSNSLVNGKQPAEADEDGYVEISIDEFIGYLEAES